MLDKAIYDMQWGENGVGILTKSQIEAFKKIIVTYALAACHDTKIQQEAETVVQK